MSGGKLAPVKQAMGFVIDNLGPLEAWSPSRTRRPQGPAHAHVGGGQGGGQGRRGEARRGRRHGHQESLDVASQILADHRYKNPVTSVILLSDGQDNCSGGSAHHLLPPALRSAAPVHTFRTCALSSRSFHPGVKIREVKPGVYKNRVDADRRAAFVEASDLYADKVRRFMFFVDVPIAAGEEHVTQLVSVRCTYRDAMTGRDTDVAGEDAVVQQPAELRNGRDQPSRDVESASASAWPRGSTWRGAGAALPPNRAGGPKSPKA
ncbi:hypothetical protein QOZ80_1AG0010250 [Eleusine coracana subsp. coracana]|nr:hypothetical protein QOZ80_1AG0010250 [Eleusine coracana subsp. coracana]